MSSFGLPHTMAGMSEVHMQVRRDMCFCGHVLRFINIHAQLLCWGIRQENRKCECPQSGASASKRMRMKTHVDNSCRSSQQLATSWTDADRSGMEDCSGFLREGGTV